MPSAAKRQRGRDANREGKAWEQQVIALARQYGWLVATFDSVLVTRGDRSYYATPTGADGDGFPDTVLVRDRVLYRECKLDGARLSKKQRRWHDALEAAGQDVGVWRPQDIARIIQELRR